MNINTHNYAVKTRAGVRCTYCGQHASEATKDCPGKRLDYVDSHAVREGLLDYRDGKWVLEPSAAYQRTHDANPDTELSDEEPKSLWGYMPVIAVALFVIVSLASIYELIKVH